MILVEEKVDGSHYRLTPNNLVTIWLPSGYEHIYLIGRSKHTKTRNCKLEAHQRILDDCLKAENHLDRIYNEETLRANIPVIYRR